LTEGIPPPGDMDVTGDCDIPAAGHLRPTILKPLEETMKNFTQQTGAPDPKLRSKLTDEVVSRYKDCPDPRLKEIMISPVKHLHSFARCRRN
jgi:hypothetical protein